MLRAFSTSLAAALLLTCAPCLAFAADDELPRRRPRITDPTDAEETLPAAGPKRSRSHARPIESDDPEAENGEELPTPRALETPAPFAGDESLPAANRDEESWDESPRRGRGHADGAEWRDERRPRSTRTAEEELGEVQDRPRRLANLDEPGNGLAAELQFGVAFLHDAVEGSRATFAFGLTFDWQLGRLFAPESRLLHQGLFLEAGWLHPLSSTEGTDWVKVSTSQHDLWLAVLFGYPFKGVHVYGKLGPAMSVQPVGYDVQGTTTEWRGVKAGVVYGLGARTTLYLNRAVGIAGRLEVTRLRRGYLDDTLLSGGVGMAF